MNTGYKSISSSISSNISAQCYCTVPYNLHLGILSNLSYATGYLIYSQLSSTSGGRLFHPQPEDVPCRGDGDPLCGVLYINNGKSAAYMGRKSSRTV